MIYRTYQMIYRTYQMIYRTYQVVYRTYQMIYRMWFIERIQYSHRILKQMACHKLEEDKSESWVGHAAFYFIECVVITYSSCAWSYITWPIAGQCIFISQCDQSNFYNETGLLPGTEKLNDFQ